jgi:hypothetical protein
MYQANWHNHSLRCLVAGEVHERILHAQGVDVDGKPDTASQGKLFLTGIVNREGRCVTDGDGV